MASLLTKERERRGGEGGGRGGEGREEGGGGGGGKKVTLLGKPIPFMDYSLSEWLGVEGAPPSSSTVITHSAETDFFLLSLLVPLSFF